MDINTDLIFGRSYEMLRKSDMRVAGTAIQNGWRRFNLCFQYPAIFRPGIGKWLDFGTWFLPDSLKMIQTFLAIGTQTALRRIQNLKAGEGHKDILSCLIDGVDPETGTNFDTENIVLEANILLNAGGDTVGTALCVQFFYLSRNPQAYNTLASEIRSTFQNVSEISLGPKLDSCIYLHACVEEALRLFAGTAFWRDADEGGATVLGEYIPTGFTVGSSPYVLHHNTDYFPDPFRYDPERWIPGRGCSAEQIKMAKMACNPFSLGPRSCIAKNLAVTTMLLTVATVMWSMDFRVAEGESGRLGEGGPHLGHGRHRREEFRSMLLYSSFTLQKDGSVLQFKKRNAEAKKTL